MRHASHGAFTSRDQPVTGHAWRTVGKYLNTTDGRSQWLPRAVRPSKLDPFKTYLEDCVRIPGWIARGILQELRARGFRGGYAILEQYLRPHRATTRQREFDWMLAVLQRALSRVVVMQQLDLPELDKLLACVGKGRRSERNRALAVLALRKGISQTSVASFLHINRTSVQKYSRLYREGRPHLLFARRVRNMAQFARIRCPVPSCGRVPRSQFRSQERSPCDGRRCSRNSSTGMHQIFSMCNRSPPRYKRIGLHSG